MKPIRAVLISIIGIVLCTSITYAQVTEVKDAKVSVVNNPKKQGEFYLKVAFKIPTLPVNARLTDAYLVLDQQFETSKTADSTISPKGFVNKTTTPFMLAAYGFDSKKDVESKDWTKVDSTNALDVAPGIFVPQDVVKSEKKKGKWREEAVTFSVTQFIHGQKRAKNDDIVFLITTPPKEQNTLHASKVDVDASKISGRLVLVYAEPPIPPAWHKKK